MAITLGTPAASTGGNTDNRTLSFTVAAGSERVLVVAVALDIGGNPSVSSLTYGGDSLVRAVRSPNGGNKNAEIWYLVNPPVGTANIVATYSATNNNAFGAIVLYGVRQSVPLDSVASSATQSTDITTFSSGALIVDVLSKDNSLTVGADQTQQWSISYSFNVMQGSTEAATTPGAYTMSWTGTPGSCSQAVAAFAPGQGGSGIQLPNMGVRPAIFSPGIAR